MTLPGAKYPVKRKPAGAHPDPPVEELVNCGNEEFLPGLKEKKRPIASGFKPAGMAPHKVGDLGLRKTQAGDFCAKTIEKFGKRPVARHLVNPHSRLWRLLPRRIAAPLRKVGINVSENGACVRERLLAVRWVNQ